MGARVREGIWDEEKEVVLRVGVGWIIDGW